jgi:hypothetical protein
MILPMMNSNFQKALLLNLRKVLLLMVLSS